MQGAIRLGLLGFAPGNDRAWRRIAGAPGPWSAVAEITVRASGRGEACHINAASRRRQGWRV